jgi:hypothetical protein
MKYISATIVGASIIGITLITLYGLSRGLDGTTLLTSIIVISGLGGYIQHQFKKPPKGH